MSKKMKDSGIKWIGEIPESWKILTNNKCFLLQKEIVGDNFDNYQLLSLTKRGVVCKDINSNAGKLPENWNGYQVVLNNQIILCLFDLDCSAVFSGISNYNGMISPAYKILSCKKIMSSLFAEYWFRNIGNDRIYKMYSKSLRYVVNAGDFGNIPIIVPQIEEQISIANYLDAHCSLIDQTIEKLKQVIEKLKKYKQSVITEAVTKGLNPNVLIKDSGIEWIGAIPEHWEVKRLRYIGKCQNGISKAGEFFGNGYPFVSYGDVYNNLSLPENVKGLVESSEEEQNNYSVIEGDIFFTRTSETIEEIGLVSVCLSTISKATFAGFLIRVRPFENQISSEFSKYYFSSEMHRRYFVKEMNLVIRASLSQELLKKLPVLLPPQEEQKEIAKFLDKKCKIIDGVIENKVKVIDKLESYKKSLIYECVTGKREVK